MSAGARARGGVTGKRLAAGLTRWLGRHDWRESFEDVIWLDAGPACERAEITLADGAGVLGEHWLLMR